MAIYPKQLQFYTENSIARGPDDSQVRDAAPGERTIISDGFTPPGDLTVNDILFDISVNLYGLDASGITFGKRTRPEHRPFKDDFGQEVVFPAATPISGAKTVNELIAILRVLWKNARKVGADGFGHATSVLS
jgi:hypothetical protein